MTVSLATTLLGVLAIEFLLKLWASRQADEGNNPALAGAILGGL